MTREDVGNNEVVIHSTVLLSVVDHYTRVAKGTTKRVVGALLGETIEGLIHVTNTFAVPFDEDPKDTAVWFLDHNYLESLFVMFRKVNRKERIVGWYSTGPKIKCCDLEIHERFRNYCPNPIYVIVDVQLKTSRLPTSAYLSKEQAISDRVFQRKFVHVPSTIGAFEIEEVGVEHLLRDLKNASTSTLSTQIDDKLSAVGVLVTKLRTMAEYLQDVIEGNLRSNNAILYNLQNMFNYLPEMKNPVLVDTVNNHMNDCLLAIYLGAVVRAVVALHNLINNKLENKQRSEETGGT